uniref:Solute carrier organic anion transporter family member n=1 Tax=Parastrongyloides trichosuri TaxID=131310 RepID=A0A0N4ZG73_PARTI
MTQTTLEDDNKSEPNIKFELDAESLKDNHRRYGFGSYTPNYLQFLNNPYFLSFFMGLASFVQSLAVNGAYPMAISSLERRYNLNSKQTGTANVAYDLSVALVVFYVCKKGNSGHKGRWIAGGVLFTSIGCLLCALPHFLYGTYQVPSSINEKSTDLGQCTFRNITTFISSEEPNYLEKFLKKFQIGNAGLYFDPIFLMLFFGMFINGAGSTPLFSIGTAYLDENVSQQSSAMFLAVNAFMQALGPVFGMMGFAYLLNIYVDFDRVDHNSMNLKDGNDPRWIGAWWLSFLITAVASVITAIPLFGYPTELPGAKRYRMQDIDQRHQVAKKVEDKLEYNSIFSCIKSFKYILVNPPFMFIILENITESMILNGFSGFMPKIMENLLAVSPLTSGFLSSYVIIAVCCGVMLGGALLQRLKLQLSGMLKINMAFHILALFFMSAFIFHCPPKEFVGINEAYPGTLVKQSQISLNDTCNADCYCNSDWNPVCHVSTKKMYFSPCFAGCKERFENEDNMVLWKNCSCVPDESKSIRSTIQGFCESECGSNRYIFIALIMGGTICSFAAGIPAQQALLRMVPFQSRSFAIAINWVLLRLLGFLPGGYLFGAIIDGFCLKWNNTDNDQFKSCLVMDTHGLAMRLMQVCMICKLISILGCIVAQITYKPTERGTAITTDSEVPCSFAINDDRTSDEKLKIRLK